MGWRVSARLTLTLLTTAMTLLAVVLIAFVRDAWVAGVLIALATAAVSWALTGALVQPLRQMRRDLMTSLRTRELADSSTFEPPEVHGLRTTLMAVLLDSENKALIAQSEQRRLLHLFEAITEGIVQVSHDARILHANAAARSLLNLPGNAEGQSVAALIRHPELREIIENAARGGPVPATEIVLDNRQLLVTPQPLGTSPTDNSGSVITIVELTELRRLESVRRDFVANVSHELKTPLTSIRGYAETLISDEMPRDVQLQFLEVIHKNAARIHRIVDELLDLSRLQSGGWQPDLQTVDVRELVRDVWTSCEDVALKKNVSLIVSADEAFVTADPGGLRQVLSNLLDNSLRYTHPGGRIEVKISDADGVVEIEVKDNGIGIPKDALPRIFERFFRVDPARSREQGGTGLGLSIVKHLVDRMSGEVTAESELGKGTTVRIRLPAAQEKNDRIIA